MYTNFDALRASGKRDIYTDLRRIEERGKRLRKPRKAKRTLLNFWRPMVRDTDWTV